MFIDVLSVMDDFERAKRAYKPKTPAQEAILADYFAVQEKVVAAMLSGGMEEVPTVGKPFDAAFHDCLVTEPSTEYEEDIITREFAKGFMMGGRCIRPAKVVVSRGA